MFTYMDGIRPGQRYILCVQSRLNLPEDGILTSDEACIMLLTSKTDFDNPILNQLLQYYCKLISKTKNTANCLFVENEAHIQSKINYTKSIN